MMSSILYGEIKVNQLRSWSENKNPYDILIENNRIEKLGGWEFLEIANKLFSDEVQVDWGSFAYKCTKNQLKILKDQTGCEINMETLKIGKIYGIVFIEEY